MLSPFPGMDPYLEQPSSWPTVRFWVVTGLAESLGPLLPDHSWVAIERRTYGDVGDTEREPYLEVRDRGETKRVVTVIEVLSPANKRAGVGREEYLRKRDGVLGSDTNLVEIDLLRGGQRMPVFEAPEGGDYRILISRGRTRPRAELIRFTVRDPAPSFPVPIHSGVAEIELDLGAILRATYERGQFARSVKYDLPPKPPLSPEDEAWAGDLLKSRPERLG